MLASPAPLSSFRLRSVSPPMWHWQGAGAGAGGAAGAAVARSTRAAPFSLEQFHKLITLVAATRQTRKAGLFGPGCAINPSQRLTALHSLGKGRL